MVAGMTSPSAIDMTRAPGTRRPVKLVCSSRYQSLVKSSSVMPTMPVNPVTSSPRMVRVCVLKAQPTDQSCQ